ncbi:MAG: hypothetical protein ACLS43_05645 [Evtepia gabavorous]
MNENTGQFRSAAFGGFHRQDVLDYLERITRENQTQKQALEQALAEEQAARAQAEARAQQAENKAAEAVADREAFEQTLAESRQAQEKITAALAEAEAQVAALREKVNDLEPGAESWRRIRTRRETLRFLPTSGHRGSSNLPRTRRRKFGRRGFGGFWNCKPAASASKRICIPPSFRQRRSWIPSGPRFPRPRKMWRECKGLWRIWRPMHRRNL